MTAQSYLRFTNSDGIDPSDFPLAIEVWFADLQSQSWVSNEATKLSVLFVRHMNDPAKYSLNIGRIEGSCRIDSQQLQDEIRRMESFGFVESHLIEREMLSVSLRLTLLQRLRILETRQRLDEFQAQPSVKDASLQADYAASLTPPGPVTAPVPVTPNGEPVKEDALAEFLQQ